jgi:hypothetical protein
LGLKGAKIVKETELKDDLKWQAHDILMVGRPRNLNILPPAARKLLTNPSGFTFQDVSYVDADISFFGVYSNPSDEKRVVGLFLPLSAEAAEQVDRKITHYGQYSYLLFKNGQNRIKGNWQAAESPLIHRWD